MADHLARLLADASEALARAHALYGHRTPPERVRRVLVQTERQVRLAIARLKEWR